MDDLIGRQAAIEAVQNRHMMLNKEKVLLINDLEKLPSAQPHWLPVEQALPKIGEYVLCETTTPYFGKYHVCKFVDKDKWIDKPHFDWDRNGFHHVVAWTRFEPYRGGDRMTWIRITHTLVKCPYCGTVQLKSCKCKDCKKEVTE